MNTQAPVSQIMTPNPMAIKPTQTLSEAKSIFKSHSFRHLPVVSGDKLIGILSLTDMLRISFGGNLDPMNDELDEAIFDMLSIPQVMAKHPVTVSSTDTIQAAAAILAKAEFHALPVVEAGRLVGIVSTTDVIQWLLDVANEAVSVETTSTPDPSSDTEDAGEADE